MREDLVIRGIAPGMTMPAVEEVLGSPSNTDYIQGIGATVLMYKELGMEVYANQQTKKILGWSLGKASSLRTSRGIGIGSSKAEVLRLYGPPSEESDDRLIYIVPGEKRLTMDFEIRNGAVTVIAVKPW